MSHFSFRLWSKLLVITTAAMATQSCGGDEKLDLELPTPEKRTLATKVIRGFENHSAVQVMYFAPRQAESPVVLLLHDVEGSLDRWARTGIPRDLQALGFGVIAAEMRVFEPKIPVALRQKLARQVVIDDLEAVKKFALDRHHLHQLNIRKLGIVAVGKACAVAGYWSTHDWKKAPFPAAPPAIPVAIPRGQDVQSICLVSPENYPRIPLLKEVVVLKRSGVKIQLATGQSEPDERLARDLRKALKAGTTPENLDVRSVASKRSGMELLLVNKRQIQIAMTAFFDLHVQEPKVAWVCRRNPLLGPCPPARLPQGPEPNAIAIVRRTCPPSLEVAQSEP